MSRPPSLASIAAMRALRSGCVTTSTLAAYCGCTWETAYMRLRSLCEHGYALRGHVAYCLTPAGRAALVEHEAAVAARRAERAA